MAEHVGERLARDEHRGAVEHVLARRPEMDEGLVLDADAGAQRAYERLDRVSDRVALAEQLLPAKGVGVCAGGGDRVGSRLRDHAHRGARRGQRPLDLEQSLEPGPPRHRLADRGGDEQRVERGHTAKNVVCAGPWRRMSKRSPPSSATATSGSRCSGASRESTGSAAFGSTSSGK